MNSVIGQLRDLLPERPLGVAESLRIAEHQASRFLKLTGIDTPPVPDQAIALLPRIQVERSDLGSASGSTVWRAGRWIILLNQLDSPGRQRFSLAHEFKHVLDNPFDRYLYPAVGDLTSERRKEQVADHFSACLLMPKAWVKREYYNAKVHQVPTLAEHFEASQQAMDIRLRQLGVTDNRRRCDRTRAAA